ncbi:MAG: hypothetical protein AAGD25_13515 [Cyanobacteria bacterium P01_F01_bin.150]
MTEVWRYTKQKGLIIYHLGKDGYKELSPSQIFPNLSSVRLKVLSDRNIDFEQLADG